jgi:methylthioribose-1-phosphate isomerase
MADPNFFRDRTVRWEDGRVVLIDQRKLPNRFAEVRFSTAKDVAEGIKQMVVRGAPAIGAAAAMALALTAYHSKSLKRESMIDELEVSARLLEATRPTGRNLFWGINRVLAKARGTRGPARKIRDVIVAEAISIAEEDVLFNKKMGIFGAELIEDGETILTHCK